MILWSVIQDDEHGNVLKVTGSDKAEGYWLQHAIDWEAGKTYSISYWMKTDSIKETSRESKGYIEAKNVSGEKVGTSTLVPVYANAQYNLKFYIKANSQARESFVLRTTEYSNAYRKLISGSHTNNINVNLRNTDDWQEVTVALTVNGTSQYLDLSFLTNRAGAEFRLSGAEIEMEENQALNWSFEIGDKKPVSWTYSGSGTFDKVLDNQVIYENPSPGNKAGGITTLEEKSLGCIQKGGGSSVVDVLDYGDVLRKNGLSLLNGPGNDMVAITNLTATGVHMILFTTGRGTPLGGPVPTIKISTNSKLAQKKSNWIDYDASGILEEDLTDDFLDYIISVASGEQTKNEKNGYREISIFKDGIVL